MKRSSGIAPLRSRAPLRFPRYGSVVTQRRVVLFVVCLGVALFVARAVWRLGGAR